MNDVQQRLAEDPDALYRIIADSYRQVLRTRGSVNGRSGKTLEAVLAAVFPRRWSHAPFPQALREAMAGRSQRSFAKEVPCNQATLSRLLSGQLKPEMLMMERIAVAAGLEPWFFVEWRAEYVSTLVRQAMLADPALSVTAIEALRALGGRDGRDT